MSNAGLLRGYGPAGFIPPWVGQSPATDGSPLVADTSSEGGVKLGAPPASVLIASVALGASQTTLAFSGIPATFHHLHLIGQVRTDKAATLDTPLLRFNSDSGANYAYQQMNVGGSSTFFSDTTGATSVSLASVPGSTGVANQAAAIDILIPNYAGTIFTKSFRAIIASGSTTAAQNSENIVAGVWNSTAAINAITLLLGGANYVTGSVAYLYGLT